MSPLAATLHAAEFLEKEQDFGSVEAGRMADLVLLTKDPLESIGNTRTIHTLIFDGTTYSREYLDGMLERVLKHVAPASPQFALWDASIKGDEEVLKNALGEGANANGLDTLGNPNGRRALNYAVIRADKQLIKLLLDHGADVNPANRNGFTPLHHAAEFGAFDSAKLLIERGADVALKTKRGCTPLRIAESRRRNQIADAILQVAETADNHSQ